MRTGKSTDRTAGRQILPIPGSAGIIGKGIQPEGAPREPDGTEGSVSHRNISGGPGKAGKVLAMLLCLAAAGGCQRSGPGSRSDNVTSGKDLLIGLIPEQNIFHQIERYDPLADYLSRKSGIRIRLKILPRYGNIIQNFRESALDGAFFGSFTYALAHETLRVSVIARPVAPDNSSTYHGLIFVRKDSGIRTLADMKGKRFAFVDRATTAGFLLPLEYFHNGGVKNYRAYFRETYFAGTHEDAIRDVLDGKAEAGAAKNTVFYRLAKQDPRILEELTILKRSPDVPENGLALKTALGSAVRQKIGEALLAMHENPEGAEVLKRFGAVRFIPTSDRDYDPVYRYAREVGLDLSDYQYFNR